MSATAMIRLKNSSRVGKSVTEQTYPRWWKMSGRRFKLILKCFSVLWIISSLLSFIWLVNTVSVLVYPSEALCSGSMCELENSGSEQVISWCVTALLLLHLSLLEYELCPSHCSSVSHWFQIFTALNVSINTVGLKQHLSRTWLPLWVTARLWFTSCERPVRPVTYCVSVSVVVEQHAAALRMIMRLQSEKWSSRTDSPGSLPPRPQYHQGSLD